MKPDFENKKDYFNLNNNNAIQTFNLTKKFGNRTAVNSINLAIQRGKIFALLGPNGAGKTTTIKMLCCLLKPTAGKAIVMGYDIEKEQLNVKQIINISPQETAVARNLTIMENLLLMGGVYGINKHETKTKAQELIELFGLSSRTKELAKKLSGGMQRRLNLAMALITNPQVLFLDEPTLGLDPQARKAVWIQIEKLKGSTTIFLTTHYLEEADALADHIAIIHQGNIIAQGSPAFLKESFSGKQTMMIKASGITDQIINTLKEKFLDVRKSDNEIIIQAKDLDFENIVDLLRGEGVKIKWLSMKEPSLDDVFLKLTTEEKNQ
jgi:ABC-2 type transport system ATP-binding protein